MATRTNPSRGRLADKVALVTGAGSGIGEATATLLVGEGARVVFTDLNEATAIKAMNSVASKRNRTLACRLDVTEEAQWQAVIKRVLTKWTRLDILVNNAGIASTGLIEEMTLAEWRRVMSVNLEGVMLGTKHAMRVMNKTGGTIINIASASGVKAIPRNSAYGVSKAGVRFLTRVAALEGAPHKIRVNSISPGGVATPMWEQVEWWPAWVKEKGGRSAAMKALTMEKGFAGPIDIARAVLFLAGNDSQFVTGVDLPVDAGFTAG